MIETAATQNSLDKAYANAGAGLEINDVTNDLKTVSNESAILQAMQNRILAERGSWLYDLNFGSTMNDLLRTKGKLTEIEMAGIIQQALDPMLRDGRIQEITSVKLVELNAAQGRLVFEIKVVLGSKVITQTYTVNYL